MWVDDEASWTTKSISILQILFYGSGPIAFATGAIKTDDKLDAVFLASVAIGVLVQATRQSFIVWNKNEMLDALNRCCSHIVQDHEEFVRINRKVNVLMAIGAAVALGITFGCGAVFIIDAVVQNHSLPLNIGFPLDWKNTEFGYWMAYAYLVGQLLFATLFVSLNLMIWYILLNFGIQYELLGHQFRRMGSSIITRKNISNKRKEFLFIKEFVKGIRSLQNIRQ